MRALLRGLAAELSGEDIRATEIVLSGRRHPGPEACAEVARRALFAGVLEGCGWFETLAVAEGAQGR